MANDTPRIHDDDPKLWRWRDLITLDSVAAFVALTAVAAIAYVVGYQDGARDR